jgi:two-component system, chemotaxis family, sensor kinase Cph1
VTRDAPWLSDRTVAAERETGTPFDLSACVREPIHRLGGIQSYGALLALAGTTIAVASDNAATVLGLGPLRDEPIGRVLDEAQLARVRALADADTGQTAMMPVELPGGRRFDVTVHRSDDLLVLEFEPAREVPGEFGPFYAPIRQALMRLQQATTVLGACRAAVAEIRAITGFDRVVAYRFESADGPGEVIAEQVRSDWEPWLDLWFPATDIPPQARRLYERNWIRVIADVDDVTAQLDPPVLDTTGEPLDLSLSVLRTVSPFHLEYLRNIGVTSSMSVSLLAGERLWGLIACHGRDVKPLGPHLRAACEFFGVALSLQLAALRERDEAAAREQSREVIARLMETVSGEPAGWADRPAGVPDVVACDAVAVRTGGRTVVHGDGPAVDAVEALWAALPAIAPGETWAGDRLGEQFPALAPHAATLSGALVLSLSATGDAIAWLRGERTTQRRWAADPARPVVLGPHGGRLTPRGSTAVFRASVRGRSLPFSPVDRAMAAELGRATMAIAVAHAQQLAALNAELSRSNVDLDAFAHAAAHDLKEPLRGIANTATFLAEDAGDGIDEVSRRRLDTIQRLAVRMDELLSALLYYSRLGRTDLRREHVPLRDAVLRAAEVAGARLAEAGVTLTAPEPGATVWADPVLFDEVLVNLLVNAAKYARPDGPRSVEVGAGPDGGFFVRDNGIGLPEHLREQAFDLFRRLHPGAAPHDGSGAGLAIVRRVVERHGGQIWVEDSPGGGLTVRATLPGDPRSRQ